MGSAHSQVAISHTQAPEQGGDHEMSGGVGRVDDSTDGLGDGHPHDERADEVEEGGETDGETGLERARVDDRGNGVAAVMKAVQKVEEERDSHYRDQ